MNELEQQRQSLREFERSSRLLEPDADTRAQLFELVNRQAEKFTEKLDDMPAYCVPNDAALGELEQGFADDPGSLQAILDTYANAVQTPGVNEAVGRFFGFIPGSGLYTAALGDFLAAVTNPYAGVTFAGPGAVRLERSLLRWLAGVVDYPDTALGDLTSGGSIAMLSAIVTARTARELRARDIEQSVVYLTTHTHHCVSKALRVAGLGECVQRQVGLSADYRMDPTALARQIESDRRDGLKPWLIIASAGTTDTGTIDPLDSIADVAESTGLWLHVDGAYGAMFALTADGRQRLQGLSRADSLVMNPHKGLFLPFGTGVVLVRNGEYLRQAFAYSANYLKDTLEDEGQALSLSATSPELSRHFRGLRLWLPLKLAGIQAFREALEEKLLLARHAHARLCTLDDLEIGPQPDLTTLIFRYRPDGLNADAFNDRLAECIRLDGRIFLSSTIIDGDTWLRMAILNVRTHLTQVELAIDVVRTLAQELMESLRDTRL